MAASICALVALDGTSMPRPSAYARISAAVLLMVGVAPGAVLSDTAPVSWALASAKKMRPRW